MQNWLRCSKITTNQREHVQRRLNQAKKVSTIAIVSSDERHTNPNPGDIDDVFIEEEVPNKDGLPHVIPTEPKPAVTIPGMSERQRRYFLKISRRTSALLTRC